MVVCKEKWRASQLGRGVFFFFQAEDGIRDVAVTGVQTCALPIFKAAESAAVVLVLDEPEVTIRTAGALIYLGTALPEGARDAEVVLPIANVAEEEGTFVNRDGRVQRYFQAKPAPGMARPAWWVLAELLAALGRGESLAGPDAAFDRLARPVGPVPRPGYASPGALGKPINAGVGAGATA